MQQKCNCPVILTAKITLRNGKILYARSYGKKAFPITIHQEGCPHRKVKQPSKKKI